MQLVTMLDRAFQSAKNTYGSLPYLDSHKVGFIAATQPIDTSTSTDLSFNLSSPTAASATS